VGGAIGIVANPAAGRTSDGWSLAHQSSISANSQASPVFELRPDQHARLRVRRDGPRVIDVSRVMEEAARLGLFVRVAPGGADAE
jgi:hypothetical protein